MTINIIEMTASGWERTFNFFFCNADECYCFSELDFILY